MHKNILEYLEETVSRLPDKVAYASEQEQLTFREVYDGARSIGSFLSNEGKMKEPIIIFMEKCPRILRAFFGVIYSGCFYVPIDEEMPAKRVELILENTKASLLICDRTTQKKAEKLNFQGELVLEEEICQYPISMERLKAIRRESIDMDPIYVLYTSGSTGVPKGVLGHHRGLIDYMEQFTKVLGITEETVFGNQTPYYFDASMKEIYATMKCGATTWQIPKELFLFPIRLVKFLNTHKINTLCWVVSAYTMISAFGTFEEIHPETLHTLGFGSEVFPIEQFKIWQKELPHAKFFNLYGPTETTGVSCYYEVDHIVETGEVIPIGQPFENTGILLMGEDGKEAKEGEIGEIYIRGTGVTHGYYRNLEKTASVFVKHPLNEAYREFVYRTGDMAYYNEKKELVFLSRKDFQIKHMGHRIELGEIDANVSCIKEVRFACTIYLKEEEKIILFYTGEIEKKELTKALKEMLPRYMLPNAMVQLENLPMTTTGKMDRKRMEEIYRDQKTQRRNQYGRD